MQNYQFYKWGVFMGRSVRGQNNARTIRFSDYLYKVSVHLYTPGSINKQVILDFDPGLILVIASFSIILLSFSQQGY